MNEVPETEVFNVDTSLRDGLQGIKADPAVAADVLERYVPTYLELMKVAGTTHFDAVSTASPKLVPVMGVYPQWLQEVQPEVMDSLYLQALVFNGNNGAVEILQHFVQIGRIKSLAFVHSHDPDFLWANSNIRKHSQTGEEISREDAPHWGADILWQSRQKYENVRQLAESLGLPLHVYMSRATGTREDAQTIQTADVEAVMAEMGKIDLLPNSHFIVCDTDAVNDHVFLGELLQEVRGRFLETNQEIGVHLHVLKNDPQGVQRLIRSAVQALHHRRIYMETGMAGLGGCIILKDASANLDVLDLIRGLQEMGVRMLPFEPDVQALGRARVVMEAIQSELKLKAAK